MTPLRPAVIFRFVRSLLVRHETVVDPVSNLKAGVGALLGMAIVGQLAIATGLPLLVAPLGATALLLFGQPSSPLSQPVNVMVGYLVGTICCEAAIRVFPGDVLTVAIALGVSVVVMRWLRVTHPPAGAMPIMGLGAPIYGFNLFLAMFVSCVVLITLALVVHQIPPRRDYPLDPD